MEKKLTKQEAFDKAVRGLASQGWERSVDVSGLWPVCSYRGPGGRRCAIGWLISDELAEDREGCAVREFDYSELPTEPNGRLLLLDMQNAHDAYCKNTGMRERFVLLGEKHDLDLSVFGEEGI